MHSAMFKLSELLIPSIALASLISWTLKFFFNPLSIASLTRSEITWNTFSDLLSSIRAIEPALFVFPLFLFFFVNQPFGSRIQLSIDLSVFRFQNFSWKRDFRLVYSFWRHCEKREVYKTLMQSLGLHQKNLKEGCIRNKKLLRKLQNE